MKRLSIAELKAQKGAIANSEVFTGGAESGCHILITPGQKIITGRHHN